MLYRSHIVFPLWVKYISSASITTQVGWYLNMLKTALEPVYARWAKRLDFLTVQPPFFTRTHTYSHLMKAYVKPVWGEKSLDDIKHQRRGTFRVNKSRAVRAPPRTARTDRDWELAKHTHCTYPHTLDQPMFIKGHGSQSARVIEREREITNALREGKMVN